MNDARYAPETRESWSFGPGPLGPHLPGAGGKGPGLVGLPHFCQQLRQVVDRRQTRRMIGGQRPFVDRQGLAEQALGSQ